jgi:hypothetical protein
MYLYVRRETGSWNINNIQIHKAWDEYLEYIEDIQCFLMNMKFISRVRQDF